jgi:hypothetical protein
MKLPIFQIPVTLCAAIFFVSLAGCDGQPKNKPTLFIPQVIKDYCIFKDSSFWVYQDSLTGALDSQCLKSSAIKILDHPRLRDKSEMFIGELYSSYYNDVTRLQTFITDAGSCSFEESLVHAYLFHSDTVLGKRHFFRNNEYYLVQSKRDSIIIAGQKFSGIFEVVSNSNAYSHKQQQMFLSRHSGIVKYTTTDGHIWELIRSKTLH